MVWYKRVSVSFLSHRFPLAHSQNRVFPPAPRAAITLKTEAAGTSEVRKTQDSDSLRMRLRTMKTHQGQHLSQI